MIFTTRCTRCLTGEQNGCFADFGALADLAKALRQAFVLDGVYSVHRRRRHGRAPAGLSGHRFLGYLQNHDQIGNRAQGERSRQLMSLGRLKMGAALVFTSPFVPMLFQGEEWGASTPFLFFTDHHEPNWQRPCAKAVAASSRPSAGGPRRPPTRRRGKPFCAQNSSWPELSRAPHAEILDWHKKLIQLRRHEPALADGRMDLVNTRFGESARWFVVERGPLTVAFNLAKTSQCVPLREGKQNVLLASEKGIEAAKNEISLPPDAVAILKLDLRRKENPKA